MINQVVVLTSFFLINSFIYCMDSQLQEYPHTQQLQLDFRGLILRKDLSEQELHSQANLLLTEGANPHYIVPKTKKTYLMLSVQNNNCALVKFFIGQNVKCKLRDAKKCNARDYNIIHNEGYLKDIDLALIRYAKYQKQVATNRVVFPDDEEVYEEDETFKFDKANCRFFFEALRIDRMLECKKVPCEKSICGWLKKSVLTRNAIRYAFAQLCEGWTKEETFSEAIYALLYEKMSKRHSL